MGSDAKKRNRRSGGTVSPSASRTGAEDGQNRPRTPSRGGGGRAKSGGGGQPRSMASRMGLQKKGAAPAPRHAPPPNRQPPRRNTAVAREQAPGFRPAAPRPTNPQQAGYRQGAPRPNRRITQNELKRQAVRRRIFGILALTAALAAGVILSVNLLFKVTGYRIENMDRTVPANTGIYTEQQITDALGVAVGDNLFGFSTGEKTQELAKLLPYFDQIRVDVSLPGTVVVKVHPATERYEIQVGGQWAVLSDAMKVLKLTDAQPEGLIWLEAQPAAGTPQVGGTLALAAQNTALENTDEDAVAAATGENALYDANAALQQLRTSMETYGILQDVTVISLQDLSEISFLYQGRVSVRLGTINNLDYKMHLSSNTLLDVDGTGISSSDRGTLDVSYQQSDGEIRGYFQLADPGAASSAAQDAPADSGGQ